MPYHSLQDCIIDLEKNGHLIRVKSPVDPNLELSTIHYLVHEQKGPALFFENVIGTRFPAVSNLFGTIERSRFLFQKTLPLIQKMVHLRNNPIAALKQPFHYLNTAIAATKALPRKSNWSKNTFEEIAISDLPLIKHWPMDGGAFVTLPAVYSEDIDQPGIMQSNLGMYRIQLSGNDYVLNKEIGLHYQLHRGIGVHQTKANAKNQALKVSIFVGGPPSLPLAAVMPLPEGISELTFAGALEGKRFKYAYNKDGYCIALDADFVITGEVYPNENKSEGPFGDHLGYYSLKHDFPLMRVHKVYAKKNGIWPFTVVGRPPQEDTSFGHLIHEITGDAIPKEIPGLHSVHAVDASGVHPLLFAIGSERYTPYHKDNTKPQELLTLANHVLGTGQLSLAKFLFIANKADDINLDIHHEEKFLEHMLCRIDFTRDLHFHTQFTIDTLDYSGEGLNSGSKLVLAAAGKPIRTLSTEIPDCIKNNRLIQSFAMPMKGIIAIALSDFKSYGTAAEEMAQLNTLLKDQLDALKNTALIVVCDAPMYLTEKFNHFIWTTFTRCNPSHDIYGIESFTKNKHFGCHGPLIIDARAKPHHAPVLELDESVVKKVQPIVDEILKPKR
jgi:4-hydroxy-3-polyprenylbenzoate decarboxylase